MTPRLERGKALEVTYHNGTTQVTRPFSINFASRGGFIPKK